jgi:hypothetical protein
VAVVIASPAVVIGGPPRRGGLSDADEAVGLADGVDLLLLLRVAAEEGQRDVHDGLQRVGERRPRGEPGHAQVGQHRDVLDGEDPLPARGQGEQVVHRLVVDVAVDVHPALVVAVVRELAGAQGAEPVHVVGVAEPGRFAKSRSGRPSARRPGPISRSRCRRRGGPARCTSC